MSNDMAYYVSLVACLISFVNIWLCCRAHRAKKEMVHATLKATPRSERAEVLERLGLNLEDYQEWLEPKVVCSGDDTTCKVEECEDCGRRECPHREPLHYHHDGCPACDIPHESYPECTNRCRRKIKHTMRIE